MLFLLIVYIPHLKLAELFQVKHLLQDLQGPIHIQGPRVQTHLAYKPRVACMHAKGFPAFKVLVKYQHWPICDISLSVFLCVSVSLVARASLRLRTASAQLEFISTSEVWRIVVSILRMMLAGLPGGGMERRFVFVHCAACSRA